MNHRELLADPNVDVVCIATPDHIHGYQVIDAVQAGKDVYCEKPVTHWRQFELTKQLAGEVSKSDRVFQLGTQGMSDSAWRQARQTDRGRADRPADPRRVRLLPRRRLGRARHAHRRPERQARART